MQNVVNESLGNSQTALSRCLLLEYNFVPLQSHFLKKVKCIDALEYRENPENVPTIRGIYTLIGGILIMLFEVFLFFNEAFCIRNVYPQAQVLYY